MRFRFSLEPVLRVAEVRENSEWNKLKAIHAEIVAATAEHDRLIQAQVAASRQLSNAATVSAAWLHALQDSIAAMRARANLLDGRLAQLRNDLALQQRAYLEIRRKADVMRNLRTSRHTAFRREEERHEQIALDDTFLHRYR